MSHCPSPLSSSQTNTSSPSALYHFQVVDQYLRQNLDHDVDLHGLAESLSVSRYRLLNDMRRITGLTVTMYHKRLRMHEAAHLLEHSDATLEEIAKTVGYEHHSKFSRAFKSEVGLSPLRYRRAKRLGLPAKLPSLNVLNEVHEEDIHL